jgi:hypothetical protein
MSAFGGKAERVAMYASDPKRTRQSRGIYSIASVTRRGSGDVFQRLHHCGIRLGRVPCSFDFEFFGASLEILG